MQIHIDLNQNLFESNDRQLIRFFCVLIFSFSSSLPYLASELSDMKLKRHISTLSAFHCQAYLFSCFFTSFCVYINSCLLISLSLFICLCFVFYARFRQKKSLH